MWLCFRGASSRPLFFLNFVMVWCISAKLCEPDARQCNSSTCELFISLSLVIYEAVMCCLFLLTVPNGSSGGNRVHTLCITCQLEGK